MNNIVERRDSIVVEALLTAIMYKEVINVENPQYHVFKVGEPERNIWSDKRAEQRRRAEQKRKAMAEQRRKQAEAKQKRSINVNASFYTANCSEGCSGTTATGLDVTKTQYHEGRRIIAVDPSVIPLGTKGTLALANGQSFAVIAMDTGGAIRGDKIDVLVASESEARELGRQSAVLTIDN